MNGGFSHLKRENRRQKIYLMFQMCLRILGVFLQFTIHSEKKLKNPRNGHEKGEGEDQWRRVGIFFT